MAGDWIKMRSNLHEDPRVVQIAGDIDADELHVVGMLWRAWSWADGQSLDGNALSVTETFLDRIVRRDGFAAALRKVGWLEGRNGALTFPRFAEHNGQTAKSRALTKDRVNKKRNASSVTDVTPQALPEKRREEKSENTAPNPAQTARPRNFVLDALASVDGSDPLQVTGPKWGSIAKALAEIRDVCPGVTAEEILRRAENYKRHMPNVTISPNALAKHWAMCDNDDPGKSSGIKNANNRTGSSRGFSQQSSFAGITDK